MNRTTKVLLAIGGVIVLSYPGIAWVSGIAIESRIERSERQALDRVPYLTLLHREYRRGVYRSTEVATYGWRAPQVAKAAGGASLPASATVTVTSNIEHGPLPGLHAAALAVVDSTVAAPAALQAELGSAAILQAHTVVGLFGGATSRLSSPALSLRLPDGSRIEWGGLTGFVAASRGQTRWSGRLRAARLAFASAQGNLELTGLEYSGAHRKAFDDLYLGTGTFTLERLEGSSPRSGGYSLQRLSIASRSKADGEFFDMRIDAAVDGAKIAAVQLKNVKYSESFEHVHGPSLASMLQAIREAQHQAAGNQMRLQEGIQDAVRRYGIDLLLHDPVLEIRQVSFAMPEGAFLLSAKISAPGLSRADLQWPAAIVALRSHAEVTASLRIDDGLVQKALAMRGSNPKAAAQLASLEQQGYLTAASGAVTTRLDYSGGKLTLNGHPFPPAAPLD